jgi:hypothetical protein
VKSDLKLLVINGNCSTEIGRKNKNWTENCQLEYFSVYVNLFCTVIPGIYLRKNVLVTNGI